MAGGRTWSPSPAASQGRPRLRPAPPPGPFSAKSAPAPPPRALGGRARRPGPPGRRGPPPGAAPWRPHGSRDTQLGARARGGRGSCSPIPRSSCCARCPPSPTSSATAGKRHERRPGDHRGREAGRDRDAGTGTRGRRTDLVLLQLLHQHLRQRRRAVRPRPLPRSTPVHSPARPPPSWPALTCAARRHGPAER